MYWETHRPRGLPVCWATAVIIVLSLAAISSLAKDHPPIPASPAPPAADQKKNAGGSASVCETCHQDKAKQPEMHPAVAMAGCEGCHVATQKDGHWTVKLAAEGNELCFTCHDNKKPPTKTNIRSHPPTVEGECLACHDPHGSKQKFMLQGSVELDKDNLCFTCHDNIEALTKKKTVHGALQMGCLTCHQTHKSGPAAEQQFGYHLVKGAPSLCLECHDGKDEKLIKAHFGQPFQNAVCTGCHNPHGSDRPKLIRAYAHPPFEEKQCDVCHEQPKDGKVSLVEKGTKELCFMCHDDKKELLTKAKVKHSYFEVDETCTTCHSPHASDQPKWLRKPVRQVCAGCHEDEALGFKRTHGPVAALKSCIICHEPHASEFPLHMRADLVDLCLTCHRENRSFKEQPNEELLVFDKISVPATLFDNCPRIPIRTSTDRGHPYAVDKGHPVSGDNILKPELGKISCVSCHSPHGINAGKKLLKTVGNNLCNSCHGAEEKDAATKKAEVKK